MGLVRRSRPSANAPQPRNSADQSQSPASIGVSAPTAATFDADSDSDGECSSLSLVPRGLTGPSALLLMLVIALVMVAGIMLAIPALKSEMTAVPPTAGMEFTYYESGENNVMNGTPHPYLVITHTHGKNADANSLFIKDPQGDRVSWAALADTDRETIRAGDTIKVDGFGVDAALQRPCPGVSYALVWQKDRNATTILQEYTVPDVNVTGTVC